MEDGPISGCKKGAGLIFRAGPISGHLREGGAKVEGVDQSQPVQGKRRGQVRMDQSARAVAGRKQNGAWPSGNNDQSALPVLGRRGHNGAKPLSL